MTDHTYLDEWRRTACAGEACVIINDGAPRFSHIVSVNTGYGPRFTVETEQGVVRDVSEIAPVLRASAIAVYRCPSSYALSRGVVSVEDEAMSKGSAAHSIAELIPQRPDGLLPSDLRAIAAEWGLLATDTRKLEGMIRRYRERYEDFEESLGWECLREQRFLLRLDSGAYLAAKPDLVAFSPDGDEAAIEDLKTGYGLKEQPGENWQALVYVSAIFAAYPLVQTVSFRFAHPRFDDDLDGSIEVFRRADWEARIAPTIEARVLAALSPHPIPATGPQCGCCDARLQCPRLAELVYTLGATAPPKSLSEMSAAERTSFLDDLLAVESYAKSARGLLEAEIKLGGGEPIETSDGRVYRLVPSSKPTRHFDLRVMAEKTHLADDLTDGAGRPWGIYMERRKTATEKDLVDALADAERRKTNARGISAARKQEIADTLIAEAREHGALVETQSESLRLVARRDEDTDGDTE